jgi:hypothetical protein
MDYENEGGYAFSSSSMSLREWFAGQALTGMDLSEIPQDKHYSTYETREKMIYRFVKNAYEIADAMLAKAIFDKTWWNKKESDAIKAELEERKGGVE